MKIKRTILYSLLFLIAAVQCLFIGGIIYEQQQHFYALPFIFLFIFLLASYFHTFIKEFHIQYDSWKSGIWIFVGTILVWALRSQWDIDPVLATAITGTSAALLPMIFKRSKYIKQIPAPVYCGAFISMSTIQTNLYFLLLAAAISFFVYLGAKTIMNGIGGKLGTLAFLGVVFAYLLYNLFTWI